MNILLWGSASITRNLRETKVLQRLQAPSSILQVYVGAPVNSEANPLPNNLCLLSGGGNARIPPTLDPNAGSQKLKPQPAQLLQAHSLKSSHAMDVIHYTYSDVENIFGDVVAAKELKLGPAAGGNVDTFGVMRRSPWSSSSMFRHCSLKRRMNFIIPETVLPTSRAVFVTKDERAPVNAT
ncbi:uncharacterized protein PADG_03455 [Paracoccidioides brasiliensis Pb18]|uniref:Uncharacterized protein n=1 Tax=Paracoccidioides brasiliensis (strain Pb18) TaxID=502780 RepID=C1G585_PARBD|nr:uncharacterized protein PADG_03455 [Paracoccidioides brasiliensis Pb18]EEH47357.2 hypothetical protein PADG_03455 [Paracoccidioides brasiliensis Pb18]